MTSKILMHIMSLTHSAGYLVTTQHLPAKKLKLLHPVILRILGLPFLIYFVTSRLLDANGDISHGFSPGMLDCYAETGAKKPSCSSGGMTV